MWCISLWDTFNSCSSLNGARVFRSSSWSRLPLKSKLTRFFGNSLGNWVSSNPEQLTSPASQWQAKGQGCGSVSWVSSKPSRSKGAEGDSHWEFVKQECTSCPYLSRCRWRVSLLWTFALLCCWYSMLWESAEFLQVLLDSRTADCCRLYNRNHLHHCSSHRLVMFHCHCG